MMREHPLHIDWGLIIPVLVLMLLGLTTLLSVNINFFRNQLIYLLLSLILFFFISQMNYKTLQSFSIPIYIISVIFLLVVLIIGFESRGAVRWVDIFGLRIQFSEILKPMLSISFAAFLSQTETKSAKHYLISVLFLVPVMLLIISQPDLGNALIYGIVAFMVLLVYGFPLKWFGLTVLPLVLVSPIFWHFLHDYQKQRLLTFIHPTSDPLGTSYNVIQAVIAVGSGQLFGKGLSEGTQSSLRFLPERHTDFIFATLSEGLGFVGSIVVLIAFIVLLYKIYTIYKHADDSFGKVLASIAFCFLLVHFFVNIGMNLGLLPIVGVTLPFVSFGGSSLIANFIFLGLLSSISTAYKDRRVLEIR